MPDVVKFPYNASRRFYCRRPRVSKNGTPEERAAKAAQEMKDHPAADIAFIGKAEPDLWSEAECLLRKLDVKKLLPKAVKLLDVFLTRNVSFTAIVARQRPKGYEMSSGELLSKLEGLSENDLQYMTGYIQGLIDGRPT
jgi:hypothetical protein